MCLKFSPPINDPIFHFVWRFLGLVSQERYDETMSKVEKKKKKFNGYFRHFQKTIQTSGQSVYVTKFVTIFRFML